MTAGERRFVLLWTAGMLVLYALGGSAMVRVLRGYAAESARSRGARLASPTSPVPNLGVPDAANRTTVLVGARINRATDFSLTESAWTGNFNLWFKWSGAALDPGEAFRIVDGQILEKVELENYQDGNDHYSEYQVLARMRMPFNATRHPFSEQELILEVEDASPSPGAFHYVADKRNSGISPEATARSVKSVSFQVDARTNHPASHRVEAGPEGEKAVGRSRFDFDMLVQPAGWSVFRRWFQALFASAAVALIALCISPTNGDGRFGLPVGGFFASVGNNIYVGAMLPNSDRATLTDMVNAVSLYTIFLVLVQSVISLYIFETLGRERASRIFDRISFAVFLLGYVALNLALPLAARPA